MLPSPILPARPPTPNKGSFLLTPTKVSLCPQLGSAHLYPPQLRLLHWMCRPGHPPTDVLRLDPSPVGFTGRGLCTAHSSGKAELYPQLRELGVVLLRAPVGKVITWPLTRSGHGVKAQGTGPTPSVCTRGPWSPTSLRTAHILQAQTAWQGPGHLGGRAASCSGFLKVNHSTMGLGKGPGYPGDPDPPSGRRRPLHARAHTYDPLLLPLPRLHPCFLH